MSQKCELLTDVGGEGGNICQQWQVDLLYAVKNHKKVKDSKHMEMQLAFLSFFASSIKTVRWDVRQLEFHLTAMQMEPK